MHIVSRVYDCVLVYLINDFVLYLFRLHLKEEASEYLQPNTIKDLVTKYSQFIQFNIFLWESRTEKVEEPVEDDSAEDKKDEDKKDEDKKDEDKTDDDDEGEVR